MKTRGTLGGMTLSFEKHDTPQNITQQLTQKQHLFTDKVFFEVAANTSWGVLEHAARIITSFGGTVAEVRPQQATKHTPVDTAETRMRNQGRGETVIVSKTVRSGGHVQATGSAIILGDVNAGAEIIAADDIIVTGTLRGVAHAGAQGNEQAIIWAQRILSPQLRISASLARADGNSGAASGPEIAQLVNGQITLRPWTRGV
ncbi:MAG: septum site-determining protein MinC [Deinococcota bacterium]